MRAKIDPMHPIRVVRKDVAALYRDANLVTKTYLRIKFRICPILRIEAYVPDKGEVVDLGCGNGLFAAILKLGSPARAIVGLDLDARKIAAARRALGNIPHLDFRLGDIGTTDLPPADAYTIIDVLYLIPEPAQENILRRVAAALRPGGVLVVKEMDTRPRRKFLWNLFQETVAVKIVGFTLGHRFHFRNREAMTALLAGLGFTVTAVPLHRGYGYPHILYVAKKP